MSADSLFSRTYRASSTGFACLMFLIGFAAFALVTTMPLAVRELHGLGLYALAYGGFVTAGLFGGVLAGQAADRWGPRRPLRLGLALSVLALLVCGGAGSIWQLVAGRCLDGFAGALVTVSVNATIARAYPAELRPRALSLMATCWIVPSLAGPPLAGFVATWASWRWVFYGLAVLTAVAAVGTLLLRIAPASAPAPAPAAPPSVGPARVGSAALLALGAGLLQYAASGQRLVHLACGLAGFGLLAATVPRLLPAGTLRAARGLPTVVLFAALGSGSYYTLESFVPLLLIGERRVPLALAGLAFTGAALGWALASWLQGHAWSRLSRRRLVRIGTGVVVGAALIAGSGVLSAVPAVVPAAGLVVCGFGMGLVSPSLTVLAFEHCPPQEQGRYAAALEVSRGLGQVVVLALAGALFAVGGSGSAGFTGPFLLILAVTATACTLVGRLPQAGQPTAAPVNTPARQSV